MCRNRSQESLSANASSFFKMSSSRSQVSKGLMATHSNRNIYTCICTDKQIAVANVEIPHQSYMMLFVLGAFDA